MNTTFETLIPGDDDIEQLGEIVKGLIGEDYATFSPREIAAVEKASTHGEVYFCRISRNQHNVTVVADLGSPDTMVTLTVPADYSNRQAAMAIHAAIRTLI